MVLLRWYDTIFLRIVYIYLIVPRDVKGGEHIFPFLGGNLHGLILYWDNGKTNLFVWPLPVHLIFNKSFKKMLVIHIILQLYTLGSLNIYSWNYKLLVFDG